ncbi:hypothetical protein Tco_1415139, partial [Tanacetum coccineum]
MLLLLVTLRSQQSMVQNGAELLKLRITLQNLQLAKSQSYASGSQFFKDTLKEIRLRLGCKNSLPIAKQLELYGKWKLKTCGTSDNKVVQIATNIAEGTKIGKPTLFVSGEESVEQIGNRADRMDISTDELFLYTSSDIEDIFGKPWLSAPKSPFLKPTLSRSDFESRSRSEIRDFDYL